MGEEVEEGGWWVYEKERASRIEGRDTDQHNRHCQPTRSSRFYVWGFGSLPSPGPGPGQIIHSLFPSALSFSFSNCLRPHRAFCHPLHSPPVTTYCSHTRSCALCHLLGSSSVCQQSRLRTQWRTTGSCPIPKPGVLSHFRRCKAQSTSTSAPRSALSCSGSFVPFV
jgi:hypothetical protein